MLHETKAFKLIQNTHVHVCGSIVSNQLWIYFVAPPIGSLPYLEIGGEKIATSGAVAMFLARELGMSIL